MPKDTLAFFQIRRLLLLPSRTRLKQTLGSLLQGREAVPRAEEEAGPASPRAPIGRAGDAFRDAQGTLR